AEADPQGLAGETAVRPRLEDDVVIERGAEEAEAERGACEVERRWRVLAERARRVVAEHEPDDGPLQLEQERERADREDDEDRGSAFAEEEHHGHLHNEEED